MASQRPATPRHLPNSPFAAARAAAAATRIELEPGDRVSHDRHGLGRTVRLEGDRNAIVDFGGDLRRVALDSPRLERL
ncbi:hypothetical protein [Cellulomonas marina]|uniref:Uncharacterized protein n=1 Tax=Cellulomonas marina TaxID=988821 RepID=A0A1I1AWX8_9CELL|nr:hypothetical protein [Cellulomonas marina]GIG30697.1 hypothetical protein Cma02nite_32970 [Cellulomonas marina]SFB42032.1 hypothetical protein SAMN05421867_1246 [Cellulomonas marina]